MNLTLGLTKSFGTRDYVFSTSDDSKVDFFLFSMLLSLLEIPSSVSEGSPLS